MYQITLQAFSVLQKRDFGELINALLFCLPLPKIRVQCFANTIFN